MWDHGNHVPEGTASLCEPLPEPLRLLTLSLLPVGTLQLTRGLSPAQDNDPSPETKDMSVSVGKAFGLCQNTLEPRRGMLIVHTSIARCRGTERLAET